MKLGQRVQISRAAVDGMGEDTAHLWAQRDGLRACLEALGYEVKHDPPVPVDGDLLEYVTSITGPEVSS